MTWDLRAVMFDSSTLHRASTQALFSCEPTARSPAHAELQALTSAIRWDGPLTHPVRSSRLQR
jgi:hypothetical protein